LEVAIIVPTENINPLVRKCVKESRLKFPDAEILILTDTVSSDDRLEEGIVVIETGNITISAKRNLGAKRTKKQYLAFIDSDAYPGDKWLDIAIEKLESDINLWVAGGPNISPPDEPLTERWVGLAQQSFLVTGPGNFRKMIKHARECKDLPSCNMVVRREDYLSIGGMRADLPIFEDKDFCLRVVRSGKKILYHPDILVYHKNRPLKLFFYQRLVWGANIWLASRHILSLHNLYVFLPTAAVLFFLSSPVTFLLPAWSWLYWMIVTVYGLVILIDSAIKSRHFFEVPGITWAILIGNLGPGIGFLAQIFRLLPVHKKIYRNFE